METNNQLRQIQKRKMFEIDASTKHKTPHQ